MVMNAVTTVVTHLHLTMENIIVLQVVINHAEAHHAQQVDDALQQIMVLHVLHIKQIHVAQIVDYQHVSTEHGAQHHIVMQAVEVLHVIHLHVEQ